MLSFLLSVIFSPVSLGSFSLLPNRELSKSMYPIQKIGDFNDILHVVKWLISKDSKWVTGQTIHVDGGLSTVKPR